MIKLGLVGCGNIGRFVLRNLDRPEFRDFRVEVIADRPEAESALKELADLYHCSYSTDPGTLADRGLDVVLEAANPSAVKMYVPKLLRAGVSVMAMSVGAFADSTFMEEARQSAEDGKSRLLLPTGGIAGLDNLKAAGLAGIEEAALTMVKAPKSLAGAPYFEQHPIDLFAIKEPTVVFEGTAAEAIKGFPSNVNVAVAFSLATLGPEKTVVKVVCDPGASRIKVEMYAKGATGELKVEVVNLPSPDNPRTSYQACCSALATLRRFSDRVQLGT